MLVDTRPIHFGSASTGCSASTRRSLPEALPGDFGARDVSVRCFGKIAAAFTVTGFPSRPGKSSSCAAEMRSKCHALRIDHEERRDEHAFRARSTRSARSAVQRRGWSAVQTAGGARDCARHGLFSSQSWIVYSTVSGSSCSFDLWMNHDESQGVTYAACM